MTDWDAHLDGLIEADEASSWNEVNLGPVLSGALVDEPPSMLLRTDGVGLLYRARMHSAAGETESLKTWLADAACAEQLLAGEHVLFVDFEDSATNAVLRLRSLGIPDDLIYEQFHYIRPDDPLTDTAARRLEETLEARPHALAVLDGITEALALNRFNMNDNTDIARFVALLPRRIQRCGAAVLSLDHVTKNGAGSRFAVGGQHKLSGLDGSAFSVEMVRAGGRGEESVARLTVSKDRPGFVRAASVGGKVAGEVHLRTAEDGRVTVTVEPSVPFVRDELGLSPAERRVLDALGSSDAPLYPREVGDRVVEMGWVAGLHRVTIQKALDALTKLGAVDGSDGRWWRTDV